MSTGKISDEAVREKTGRTRAEWFEILDREGALDLPHGQIAQILHDKYEVDGWWSQMVTVAYEQERGRREKHQKANGYEISASKTLPVPIDTLFAAWQDETVRRRWLGETGLTIRRMTENRTIRITWADQTNVEAYFTAKGDIKSQVTVQHGKLPDAEAAARMKVWWTEALGRLQAELE